MLSARCNRYWNLNGINHVLLDKLAVAIDAVVAAAGAAALCAVLVERLSGSGRGGGLWSQSGEVVSEVVCWGVALPVLFACGRRLGWGSTSGRLGGGGGSAGVGGDGEGGEDGGLLGAQADRSSRGLRGSGRAVSAWSAWVFAVGVAGACCFRAEVGGLGIFPVLTPLLLVVDRKLRPGALRPESGVLSALASSTLGTWMVASVAVLALWNWNFGELVLSMLPVAVLLVVYTALIPRHEGPRLLPAIPDIEEAIVMMSASIVIILAVVLGVQASVFGIYTIDYGIPVFSLGLAKAASWFFTIQTARHTSWCIAAVIATFGLVASRDPSIQVIETQALLPVIASFLSISQLITMLPKQSKGRQALWLLFPVSLWPYLVNTLAIKRGQSLALHSLEHPVEALIRNARATFEEILERQSKTYAAAVKEYKRRYGTEPPPGFQDWYEFAVANQSPIIDEFDTIYESISRFLKFSGKEIGQIMADAHQTPDIGLWLCSFSGATAETKCSHPSRTSDRHVSGMFNKLLGDLPGVLPDVKFLVNHFDEPRVLLPPTQGPNRPPLTVTNLAERATWDALTRHCPSQPAFQHHKPTTTTHGLSLITNLTSSLDLCTHPSYATTHGLFQAPPSFSLIEGVVPVLSTGAPSTMSDILFPSPAYVVEPEFRYNPDRDMPWARKANQIYWAGSTTGGVATAIVKYTDDGRGGNDWRRFHRQRFLTLAQNLLHKEHVYLHDVNGHIQTVRSKFWNSRLWNVFPTRFVGCKPPAACRQQKSFFRHMPWQDGDAALGAKLVFDLDGNGISGRFYKLLASKSLVLKQTLLREWHDERLVPWLHYVPVSMEMGELAEVVQWFLGTRRGEQRARELAEWGREWFGRAMREVDVKIYMWRLVLELARVGDEGRGVLK